jgi:serine/threonine-protein kinase RsbW
MPEQPAADAAGSMTYGSAGELAAVRAFVRSRAVALGLPVHRAQLLTVAVNELATNTLQHTSGTGRVRVWLEAGQVVCEVLDRGTARPFGVGMPGVESVRGRGLAIVEQICDEVGTSSGPAGTAVWIRLNL